MPIVLFSLFLSPLSPSLSPSLPPSLPLFLSPIGPVAFKKPNILHNALVN